MPLCILAAGKASMIAAAMFTLSWTHSVEKVQWQESWRVEADRLRLAEARVKGSGAGMEPGDGAILQDGWWVWVPDLAPQPRLLLGASGATVSGWTLCADGRCLELGASASAPIELSPCAP